MRIGLALVGNDIPMNELVSLGVRAEEEGFDSVWAGEYYRSAFTLPAVLAAKTTRVGIGTGIALAFVRTPLATALHAIDIDELSGGRFVLGLGSQVKTSIERWHGLTYSHPASRMAETVEAIRAAALTHLEGPQGYDGQFHKLDWTGYQRLPAPVRPPRIFVAGVKPAMIRVAARVGDGVIGHLFWSARYVDETVLPSVAQAREGFEVTATVLCSISDDGDLARRDAKRTLAFYASTRFYADMLAADGFAADGERARAAMASRDPRALEDAISDEMVATYAAAGTPAEVADQLRERASRLDLAIALPAYVMSSRERILEQYEATLETLGSVPAP